jgi:hypothetical protein
MAMILKDDSRNHFASRVSPVIGLVLAAVTLAVFLRV